MREPSTEPSDDPNTEHSCLRVIFSEHMQPYAALQDDLAVGIREEHANVLWVGYGQLQRFQSAQRTQGDLWMVDPKTNEIQGT